MNALQGATPQQTFIAGGRGSREPKRSDEDTHTGSCHSESPGHLQLRLVRIISYDPVGTEQEGSKVIPQGQSILDHLTTKQPANKVEIEEKKGTFTWVHTKFHGQLTEENINRKFLKKDIP